MKRYSDDRPIDFLATPFDFHIAAVLDQLDAQAVKIESGDLTNHPLLNHVAQLGRPMIVSTGMAGIVEVKAALRTV